MKHRIRNAVQVVIMLGASVHAQTNCFRPAGEMSVPRYSHTATLLADGRVLVAGGETDLCGAYVAPTSSAELYDPVSGKWKPTGAMTTPREFHTATLLRDGRVLVAGGSGNRAPTLLSSAELYDPATGKWTPTSSMTFGRQAHTATLLADESVLVAGGYGVDGDYANSLSSAELFDPVTETWTVTGSLNTRRDFHTATLLPNGMVLIAAGWNFNDPLATAELYDPSTRAWTPTSPLPTTPEVGTATLLPSGKVLVTKGFIRSVPTWAPVGQLYDPDVGTWTATTQMGLGGRYQAAALLTDGTVLICGGYGPGGAYYRSADIYDPITGLWTPTGTMTTARKNHAATRLANGNVLITGGYQENCTVLSSAELYVSTGFPLRQVSLTNIAKVKTGALQFTFTSTPGALWNVLAATNPYLPLQQWSVQGLAVEMPPGRFQFTDPNTNLSTRFYRTVSIP